MRVVSVMQDGARVRICDLGGIRDQPKPALTGLRSDGKIVVRMKGRSGRVLLGGQ